MSCQLSQLRYIDNTDFIHLHASEIITDREVEWEILTETMESLETKIKQSNS